MNATEPSTPSPGTLRRLVFSLIPVLSLLLLAEIVLRFSPFELTQQLATMPLEDHPLQIEVPGAFEIRMFSGHLQAKHFTHDRARFWRPRPSQSPFNNRGYRGPELPLEKPTGELRILAIGDSNILGNKASWVDELPDHLQTTSERVAVINAGVYGYTSHQGRIHLEEFLKYRPDVVLISFGGNDASRNLVADQDYVPLPPRFQLYVGLLRQFYLLRLIEKLATDQGRLEAPPAPPELVPRVMVADYATNLTAMVKRCHEAGAIPVILTRPLAVDYHAPDSILPMKPYYFATLEVAEQQAVALIDVDEIADHSSMLFDDTAHFNPTGHRRVGRRVATALAGILDGRGYDLEALRYRPEDPEEIYTERFKKIVSPWRSLEDNIELAKDSGLFAELRSIYRSDFTGGPDGWSVEAETSDGPPSYQNLDRQMCFTHEAPKILLRRTDLTLDDRFLHLFWVELETDSDLAVRIYWQTDIAGEFSHERSVAAMSFKGQIEDPGRRFYHLLPKGTHGVQLGIFPTRWQGSVCLDSLRVARVMPAPESR